MMILQIWQSHNFIKHCPTWLKTPTLTTTQNKDLCGENIILQCYWCVSQPYPHHDLR